MPELPIFNVPAETVVVPVYLLLPVSVVVPKPICLTSPVPVIGAVTERVSLRLKISEPLFETVPLPIVPEVLPLPT